MKKFYLLFIVIACLFANSAYAKDQSKNSDNNIQKKSVLIEPGSPAFNPNGSSYPVPFSISGSPINNPKTVHAVSTGYYFVDSYENVDSKWKCENFLFDTTVDVTNWRRIEAGPNIQSPEYWNDNPDEGKRFFRNPDYMNDSTDNAFAGPIPIGFKFTFNGINYDSFYVSTNGLIALSNRRYYYDSRGNRELRTQPDGLSKCYDPNSMDWFIRSDRSGSGLSDATPDDYGWIIATSGGSTGINGGIRNPGLNINSCGNGSAIIAPALGNLYLSQWNNSSKVAEDWGKVKFYRDSYGNKLIIYFINATLNSATTLNNPSGGFTAPSVDKPNLRPTDNGYCGVNVQVILDRRDSSVSFYYDRFEGGADMGLTQWPAEDMFRFNTQAGVSGFQRNYSYDSKSPVAHTFPTSEIQQYTHYFCKYMNYTSAYFPGNRLSVKFKQWKNTLRVCDLSWRVKKKEQYANAYSEAIPTTQANNYEILAGHDQIGQIQPVVIVQNLSNDIQGPDGINYQKQDLKFKVRLIIVNETTQKQIYHKLIKVDSLALATKAGDEAYERIILSKASYTAGNYSADTSNSTYYNTSKQLLPEWNGIPPYGFVQIYFPPFLPNDLFDNQIGRMRAYAIVEPVDPNTSEKIKDSWPFDDTLWVRFFSLRRIESNYNFKDDVTEFHVIYGTPMPSVLKWVNIDGEVVSGDNVSRYPLAPRGDYEAYNWEKYPEYFISSPTIKLNRKTQNNQNPPGVNIGGTGAGGDELRSFPINMLGKKGAVLSLSVQRTQNRSDWSRGWSDAMLVGCEHRVINGATWYSEVRTNYDQLLVQFAKPSSDLKSGIELTNIPEENWKYHFRRGGAATVTNMSAYSLFGGGGYMLGFLETDKDSALSPPVYSPANLRAVNGMRSDIYDDGIDFEYKKIFIPIPDTFITAPAEGGKNFRFRLKVNAYDNQPTQTSIPDDDDDFFVDNIKIIFSGSEDVDIEVSSVIIDWPYTIAPASQAISVPIKVRVKNNLPYNSPSFTIKTRIVRKTDFDALYFFKGTYKYNGNDEDSIRYYHEYYKEANNRQRDTARMYLNDRLLYCRTATYPYLRAGASVTYNMNNWNARECPMDEYVAISNVYIPGGDLDPLDDTTFTAFKIQFGPSFAYDPVIDEENLNKANNDVPRFTGNWNQGLSLLGYSMGGISSYNEQWAVGDPGPSSSGSIAMRFELLQQDTIKGYQVYWTSRNSGPDEVIFQLYEGEVEPTTPINGSLLETTRGWDDLTKKKNQYDKYVTVTFPGLVLPRGTYWVAVRQLMETSFDLGASASRSGMRCVNSYTAFPPSDNGNGSQSNFLNLDKSFVTYDKSGKRINISNFAYENGGGSGAWKQFAPTTGNPGYGHLNYTGSVGGASTYSRGTWIPLLRPYLGDRTYAQLPYFVDCITSLDWPVELVNFNGEVRLKGIDLFWLTASEINNYGFYVEKRVADESEMWKSISFVKGKGTTNTPQNYNYSDSDVTPKKTYQYRLRQVDADGSQSCESFSNVITLFYDVIGSISLEQNSPNPFDNRTSIKFTIPSKTHVKLEVIDLFGNSIITLRDQELNAGTYNSLWDAKNSFGNNVSAGTYIYRLTAGNEVFTGKMTLVR